MKNEYRVVNDRLLGYSVQVRHWWHWPLWYKIWDNDSFSNTNSTIEAAELLAKRHSYSNKHTNNFIIIKYLGFL